MVSSMFSSPGYIQSATLVTAFFFESLVLACEEVATTPSQHGPSNHIVRLRDASKSLDHWFTRLQQPKTAAAKDCSSSRQQQQQQAAEDSSSSKLQQQAAEDSSKQQKTAASSKQQKTAAASSKLQQQAAEDSFHHFLSSHPLRGAFWCFFFFHIQKLPKSNPWRVLK